MVSDLVRSSHAQIHLGGARAPSVVACLLIALSVYVMLPVLPPILAGAWVAALVRPLVPVLVRRIRKEGAATLITTLLVLSVLVPAAALCVTTGLAALDMGRALLGSASLPDAFALLAMPGAEMSLSPREQFLALAQQYGGSTLALASALMEAAGDVALQVFVLALSTYAFLAYDRRFYAFSLQRLPIAPKHVERLRLAFHETGRALLIGTGLTCLVQAACGTLIYLSLGVPRPFILGGITFVAAFLPGIGTALVWVPVAIALAVIGHPLRALIMFLLGAIVISSLDNLLRPWIAQRTRLSLPPVITLMSMLGGMVALGGWGLLLGPLVLRLGMEALEILREENASGAHLGCTDTVRQPASAAMSAAQDTPLAPDQGGGVEEFAPRCARVWVRANSTE
jgi:predicted PurR-regulated permease PerM